MKLAAILFPLILLSFSCSAISAAPQGHDEFVRVQVLRAQKSVKVAAPGEEEVSVSLGDAGRITIEPEGRALPLKFTSSGNDFVVVNDRPYRGVVEVAGARDGLEVINELRLEEYLVGIINQEISSRWHEDALKAQAVIARTYALYQMRKRKADRFHLASTHMDQVYGGAGAEDLAAAGAVNDTAGEVLTYDGELALSLYHSNGGGHTESAKDVWKSDYAYLRGVVSKHDRDTPTYTWTLVLSPDELGGLLSKAGRDVGTPKKIDVTMTSATDRVKRIVIKGTGGTVTMSGEDLRAIVGYAKLRSTLFTVDKEDGSFKFEGFGSGHGVGLSQWGAKGMAEKGYSYREILLHYYPGVEVERVY
jgi:stage II sporulation protein D